MYCRVKELGPGNAADIKAADGNSAAAAGAALSPQKSDLALLRNANVSAIHIVSDNHCLQCVTLNNASDVRANGLGLELVIAVH